MRPFIFLILTVFALIQCAPKDENRKVLFNGTDLSGWDTYIGPAYDTVQQKFDSLSAKGANNDPDKIFTVVQEDGQPAMRLSGNAFGAISTKDEFQNYHLKLEFKWGTAKFQPRADKPRDSGVIYHSNGPFGAAWGNWMAGQEFQVQEGDCGDYWSIAGGMVDVYATGNEGSEYQYDPNAPSMVTLGGGSEGGNRCIKNPDAEKPNGEWNILELYVYGDTSVHVMNGIVNNITYKSRLKSLDNIEPLKRGRIQIQVEGAEVFYRNLELAPIAGFPEGLIPER